MRQIEASDPSNAMVLSCGCAASTYGDAQDQPWAMLAVVVLVGCGIRCRSKWKYKYK